MLGAGRVIAIDKVPERLALARECGKAETLDFSNSNIYDALMAMTDGRGPDRCIDCVGTECDPGASADAMLDKMKAAVYLGTDRPHVLREAIYCCRKGGTISVPGVYIGLVDHIPFGAAMNKGLTFPDPRTTSGQGPEWRDRPVLRHHPQSRARSRAGPLQDLPR